MLALRYVRATNSKKYYELMDEAKQWVESAARN